MELVQSFKKRFLEDAVHLGQKDNLNLLKDDKTIYIIADSNMGSIVSETVKSSSLKSFSSYNEEKVFITLFNTKDDFAKASDKICWDSYVWVASEPNHTIHFDNKPTIKPRAAKA